MNRRQKKALFKAIAGIMFLIGLFVVAGTMGTFDYQAEMGIATSSSEFAALCIKGLAGTVCMGAGALLLSALEK
jgi:hypothetical protein